jgi:hypothetical protein
MPQRLSGYQDIVRSDGPASLSQMRSNPTGLAGIVAVEIEDGQLECLKHRQVSGLPRALVCSVKQFMHQMEEVATSSFRCFSILAKALLSARFKMAMTRWYPTDNASAKQPVQLRAFLLRDLLLRGIDNILIERT